MLVAAAVCPHPPVLIPAVASGAAPELDDLRTASIDVIRDLVDASPHRLIVIGGGAPLRGRSRGGSLRPYGVDMHIGNTADASLPLSLTIGCWLLEQARCDIEIEYVGLADDAAPDACADRVAEVVSGTEGAALLVMADLSAKLTTSSPGYVDERAAGFDRAVVGALATADHEALLRLDPGLAHELWCSGVPAFAGLAGAATTAGGTVTAEIRYDAAPYGVGYVVAGWRVD